MAPLGLKLIRITLSKLWVTVVVGVGIFAGALSAEPEKTYRPFDGSQGYALFAGSLSPNPQVSTLN